MSRRSARIKNFFRKNVPRTMDELQEEYNTLCGQLGGYTFQVEMLNANLVETKKRLVAVINETNARREMDSKATPAPAPQANPTPQAAAQ